MNLEKNARNNTKKLGKTLVGYVEEISKATPASPLSEEGKFVIGGLRARGLAVGLAGGSEKVALKIAENPTDSQTITRGVRGLLNMLLDTNIDPLDVINGLGEKTSEVLQEVREGVVSSVVADALMHVSEKRRTSQLEGQEDTNKKDIDLDDITNLIMVVNDWTTQSRDTRTKIFSLIYTLLYNSAADNPDESKARRNRFWWPEPAVVKLAVTRQIERQENVGLAFVNKILNFDASEDENLQHFQELLAKSLVAEMDSKPTALRDLIQRGADIGDKAIRAVENRVRDLVDMSEREKKRRYEDDIREDLVNDYLQTSRRAYVEKVLALSPEYGGQGSLEQKVKWAKAVQTGTMLMNAYVKAQELLS